MLTLANNHLHSFEQLQRLSALALRDLTITDNPVRICAPAPAHTHCVRMRMPPHTHAASLRARLNTQQTRRR